MPALSGAVLGDPSSSASKAHPQDCSASAKLVVDSAKADRVSFRMPPFDFELALWTSDIEDDEWRRSDETPKRQGTRRRGTASISADDFATSSDALTNPNVTRNVAGN